VLTTAIIQRRQAILPPRKRIIPITFPFIRLRRMNVDLLKTSDRNSNGMDCSHAMRSRGRHLNRYRERHPTLGKSEPDTLYGYFVVPNNGGPALRVISSGAKGDDPENRWEHVSVSLQDRCPTWEEMCKIKALFWEPYETVLQFHPSEIHYVNCHQYCLHLWKKCGENHELPPAWMIGPTKFGIERLVV
jgi:hypothetical protein